MPLFRITVPASYARLIGGTTVVVDAGSALDARQIVVRAGVPFAVTGQTKAVSQQEAVGFPQLGGPYDASGAREIVQSEKAVAGQQTGAAPVGEGEVATPTGEASRQIIGSEIPDPLAASRAGGGGGQGPAGTPTSFDQFVTAIRQAINTAGSRQDAELAFSRIIAQARRSGFGETDISFLAQQGNQLAASRFPAGDGPGPGGGGPGGGDGPVGPVGPVGPGSGGLTGTPIGGADLQQYLDMLGPNAVREIVGPDGTVIGYELDPAIQAALQQRELELGIGQNEADRQAALDRTNAQYNPFGRDAQQDAELQLALERGGLDLENYLAQREADRQAELARTSAQYNPYGLGTDQYTSLQESLARGGLTADQRIAEIIAAQQSQNYASQLNFIGNPSAVGFAVSQGLYNPMTGQMQGGYGQQAQQPQGQSSQINQLSGGAGPQNMRYIDNGPALTPPPQGGINIDPAQIEQFRQAKLAGGGQSQAPMDIFDTGFNAANRPRQQNLLGPASGQQSFNPMSAQTFNPMAPTPTMNSLRKKSDEELQFLQGSAAASGFTPSALSQRIRSVTPAGVGSRSGRL